MSDQLLIMNRGKIKQTGKKIFVAWKVFLWCLRWLSIVLFGVLFFVGLYFKLPWKVLACISIIPLVGVFVPKKIQPWVWGGLTVFIVALWGWAHLPEHNSKDWEPYQYTDALHSIQEEYLLSDAENAADEYLTVFEEHGETIFTFNFHPPTEDKRTLSAPWDPQEYSFLDFWLSEFEPAVQQIIEASRIEQCRFEIPHNLASMKPQLERINRFKGWVRLMIRSANRDLFTGDRDRAFAKLMATLNMAQHLYQQQTLFDQSGAFDVELLAGRAISAFIVNHCENTDRLLEIERSFRQLDPRWAKNWTDILAREKLTAKNLTGLMYETNPAGKVRISRNAMMALQEGLGFYPRRLFAKQHVMNRLAAIGLWLALPSNPQRLSKVVDERFDHYSLQVQKGEKLPRYSLKYIWIKGYNAQTVIDWLAMQQVGYYWALDSQFRRHRAIVNQIQIFTSLKRYYLKHGQWPDRLEQLDIASDWAVFIDPLCDQPFVYSRTEQGFRLYSLGPNGVDDDGVNMYKGSQDDILLWPRPEAGSHIDPEK